jgi:hypothetical protein
VGSLADILAACSTGWKSVLIGTPSLRSYLIRVVFTVSGAESSVWKLTEAECAGRLSAPLFQRSTCRIAIANRVMTSISKMIAAHDPTARRSDLPIRHVSRTGSCAKGAFRLFILGLSFGN